MKKKYQTELLGALHETAVGLHKIKVIDDEEMQHYDQDCLIQTQKSSLQKADQRTSTESITPVII
jgi:DNA-binding transcriptional regulator YiaG